MDKVEETVSTFDKYATQYLGKYRHYEPYLASYRAFAKLLGNDSIEILDVACGPGIFCNVLLQEKPKAKFFGIDLAPAMIELARKNISAGEFKVMDCREISSINRQFDAVLFSFCFPYLSREEVTRVISDARDLTGSGSLLYISAMEGKYEDSGYLGGDDGDRVYVYYHPLNFLIEQLNSNGFAILNIERKQFSSDTSKLAQDIFIYARAD